jgi:hypothetical protein
LVKGTSIVLSEWIHQVVDRVRISEKLACVSRFELADILDACLELSLGLLELRE